MTETVDYTTGEIVPAAPTAPNAVAITGYLQQARDWLATAVETTGPEQIAAAKAEIATAAEATKQLGLSKEIQHDATEMVRRAEWALAKSVRLAQARGEVKREREGGGRPATGTATGTSKPSASDLFGTNSKAQTTRMHALGDVEDHELEEALSEAREEGNLSRANVIRKIECRTGRNEREGRTQRATRRAPLTDFAFDASVDLLRVAERLQRVVADDRFKDNRQAIAQRAAGQINRAAELIAAAQAAINSETAP